MRVHKAERELGRANFEKIAKFSENKDLDNHINNCHLFDLFSKIEVGFNFQDAVTETLMAQATAIRVLQKQLLNAVSINTGPIK